MHEAYESLILQRTADLTSHQKMSQVANAKLDNLAQYRSSNRSVQSAALRMKPCDTKSTGRARSPQGRGPTSHTTNVCARLGGDEFAIILPQTGGDCAAILRQSFLDLIEQTRLPWQGEELRLALSIGTATFSAEISDAEELIAAADANMYRHKMALKANRPAAV